MNTLSGVLFFVAFLPYAWAILHGQTVPSPISWVIWTAVDVLAYLAAREKDPQVSRGQLVGAIAGAGTITLLTLKFGKLSLGTIELVSIVGAIIGVTLWKRIGNATYAIVIAQAVIFVGSFPEFTIGYYRPQDENPIAWCIWLGSCVCALLAVKKWDTANALQPLTFTVIEAIMVWLVVVRPFL